MSPDKSITPNAIAGRASFAVILALIISIPLGISPWLVERIALKQTLLHVMTSAGVILIIALVFARRSVQATSRPGPRIVLFIEKTPTSLILLLYLAWNIASLALTPYRLIALIELERVVILLLIFFIAAAASHNVRRAKVALFLMCAVTAVICLGAIMQVADILPAGFGGRIESSMGNPNFLAALVSMIMPVVAAFGIKSRKLKSVSLYHGLYALFCLVLIFTGTRGAVIGLAAGLLCLGLLTIILAPRTELFAALLKLAVLLLITVVIAVSTISAPNSPFRRLASLLRQIEMQESEETFEQNDAKGASFPPEPSRVLNPRLVVWDGALSMIREHPVFGWGPGAFQIALPDHRPADFRSRGGASKTDHAHNEYLQIGAELGIVGLLLFGLFLVFLFKKSIRAMMSSNVAETGGGSYIIAGVLAGIVTALIHAVFSVSLRWAGPSFVFWFLCGVSAGVARHKAIAGTTKKSMASIHLPRWSVFCLFALSVTFFGGIIVRSVAAYISKELYADARTSILSRDYDAAANLLDHSITYDPVASRPRYAAGYVETQRGDFAAARDDYLALARLAPDYADLHRNLAGVYLKLSDIPSALAEARRAVEIDARAANYLLLGICQFFSEDFAEADRALEAALHLDPASATAWMYRGDVAVSRKNRGAAIAAYEKALELGSKASEERRMLGNLRALKNQ
ncbi:MAG: hypothetical protein CMN78_05060 [Spirochaetales bacterium]|nr:hypothetical protein [Spirochaetales bacterium]